MPLRGGGWGASGATLDQFGDDWCRQCGDRKRELERELERGAADAATWVSFTSNRLEIVSSGTGENFPSKKLSGTRYGAFKKVFLPTDDNLGNP